jgi:hypothetical protein
MPAVYSPRTIIKVASSTNNTDINTVVSSSLVSGYTNTTTLVSPPPCLNIETHTSSVTPTWNTPVVIGAILAIVAIFVALPNTILAWKKMQKYRGVNTTTAQTSTTSIRPGATKETWAPAILGPDHVTAPAPTRVAGV